MNKRKQIVMALQGALALSVPSFNSGGIATGLTRTIAYKKEATPYTMESGAGAQYIRRVNFGVKVQKDSFASNEKLRHRQIEHSRHGHQRGTGPISGDLSPGTYADWFDALVRRARASVAAITGMSITIAASGSDYTITRAAGDFLAGGIKKGMVVRLTDGVFNANNLNKNIFVKSVTATVITGVPLNPDHTLTAEGPIADAELTVPGTYNYMPSTGHTDDTFTVEDYMSDADTTQSEVHFGGKLASGRVQVQPNSMVPVEFQWLFRSFLGGTSENFSSPADETSTGLVSANTGIMLLGSTEFDVVTGMDFTIANGAVANPVAFRKLSPAILLDAMGVTGNFSCYFKDGTVRDAFINETELGLYCVVATSPAADADFVSFMMPRIKLNDAGKDDPNTGLTQSVPFQALYNRDGGSGVQTEKTTIAIQDSQG
jgi:hypothetical protein